ncbi:MAG: A/G-specific adenine glycosylase [Geobacter sp.]|nr:A/G-specific adenine glycosylase [Geobacter sp.]
MKNGIPYLKQTGDCKGNNQVPTANHSAAELSLHQCFQQEGFSPGCVTTFRQLVYSYYRKHRRILPWRELATPYQILVSEVMLQQTQVDRVIPKYLAFIEKFPDPRTLADTPLPELLAAWQGLGYNRRALNLQRAARITAEQWGGNIPDDPQLLQQLPGIGPYTACAVCAFAFNRPLVFLETNIRAVLLHFFFGGQQGVTDKQLLPVAEAVLDRKNPRNWYNALMDYGSDLKRRFPNPSRRSRHHTIQSRFEGSDRQVRGAVLRLLLEGRGLPVVTLQQELAVETGRLQRILAGMLRDGLIQDKQGIFLIPSA